MHLKLSIFAENANLRVIETYKRLFDVPVGLSDHTTSNITCIAAVALGAVAIEKHFTLSRDLPGIDQKASMEPDGIEMFDPRNTGSATRRLDQRLNLGPRKKKAQPRLCVS